MKTVINPSAVYCLLALSVVGLTFLATPIISITGTSLVLVGGDACDVSDRISGDCEALPGFTCSDTVWDDWICYSDQIMDRKRVPKNFCMNSGCKNVQGAKNDPCDNPKNLICL